MRKLLYFIVLFYALFAGSYHYFKTVKVVQPREAYDPLNGEKDEEEEEGKTDEPSKYLQFHSGIRTRDGEDGPKYNAGDKWNELKKADRTAQMRGNNSKRKQLNGVVEWKERGPGNVPGRTRALYNIPGDPANKTWLAGAATGGIWRTIDGGTTWTERSIGFPALPISAFAADKNANAIYASTGESISSFYSAIGNGIFKSTDKGVSWTQIPSTNDNPDFSIVTRIIVHPDNPDIIVVTTAPHNITLSKVSSIMRTTDGGLNWTKVKEVDGLFEQVVFTPSNFNIQYASQNAVGVWKSTDSGVTWNLSNIGMTPSGRVEISVSPVNANIVVASAEGNVSGTNSDLYYSSDGGIKWSLIDVRFDNKVVDFLEGQGFYDNTIMCDPFNSARLYVGGISLFRVSLTSGSSIVDNYQITESGTKGFMTLLSLDGAPFDKERLNTGDEAAKTKVEIRFGPGLTQKAHRFLVPPNKTNGLTANSYAYQDYVDVPFIVWDVTHNKQLMVSFRDQNRNGKFDLVHEYLTNDGVNSLQNSREYLYISNTTYTISANTNIAKAGGQEYKLMYNLFPALAPNVLWNESTLPASKIIIQYAGITKLKATTEVAADGRGFFDNKNKANQVELANGVHPDHHCLIPIITNATAKEFKLLLANDGGVFVSKPSINTGITEGDWQFKGYGLNTGQFYGADKRPGVNQYIGGLQDNGTRISPDKENASELSKYTFALEGDGFEVLWNSKNASELLGTRYYGYIGRSSNGGVTWKGVATAQNSEFPFVTKLANSKDFPDRVFTVGKQGVYVSLNFGQTWSLTPIDTKFVIGSAFFLDVAVSRANANIVWAGSGMSNSEILRNLFVSSDGGKTFNRTNNFQAVPMGNITRLASHPTEPNTAYAIFSFADAPKILRTTDLGQNWEDISGFGTGSISTTGFPDVAVYCLYVRPDNPNIIWVGTEIGIVESQNNGQTWTLLNEFPHVSVWDMKGQDDQVVIATHGRGIWTATIEQSQQINTPSIVASGTSPAGKFSMRIASENVYDSIQIYANSVRVKSILNVPPQTFELNIDNMTIGKKEMKMISYKNGIPYQSMLHNTEHLALMNPQLAYTKYFLTLDEVTVNGLSISKLEGPVRPYRESLQTNHSYTKDEIYQIILRTPITVSATLPKVYFSDIAIVEPGNDMVSVEATANGLDWIPLSSYDATYHTDWQSAFATKQDGKNNMYADHEIDFSNHFNAGELLLFRLRLKSNFSITAWGWSIDYISIQETPTSVETPVVTSSSLYPNPSNSIVNVKYFLSTPSEVQIEVMDIFGKKIEQRNFGKKRSGENIETLEVTNYSAGTYLIIVKAAEERVVHKMIITE